MKQIRLGTFETNSSSTHSLVIGTPEQVAKWEDGELFVNYFEDYATEFKTKEELDQMEAEAEEKGNYFYRDDWKNGMKPQSVLTTILKLSQLLMENNFRLSVHMAEMANY